MRIVILVTSILVGLCGPVEARHHHHHRHQQIQQIQQPQFSFFQPFQFAQPSVQATTQYVPHPQGCPSRAFCACGISVRLFGHPIASLMAARAWYKFPRSAPAPNTVAVRPHHVFLLLAHIDGNMWEVYDANSGGHRTRVHARSISGYTIVNPRA